jgi:hypothetical protein
MPTTLVDEERKPELRSERPESKGFHEKTDTGRRREGARCDDAARERRRLGTDMAGGGGGGADQCGHERWEWGWIRSDSMWLTRRDVAMAAGWGVWLGAMEEGEAELAT